MFIIIIITFTQSVKIVSLNQILWIFAFTKIVYYWTLWTHSNHFKNWCLPNFIGFTHVQCSLHDPILLRIFYWNICQRYMRCAPWTISNKWNLLLWTKVRGWWCAVCSIHEQLLFKTFERKMVTAVVWTKSLPNGIGEMCHFDCKRIAGYFRASIVVHSNAHANHSRHCVYHINEESTSVHLILKTVKRDRRAFIVNWPILYKCLWFCR